MIQKAPLFLIDAYGLIYRSYFGFINRPLRNLKGQNVSALFGFSRTLINLLDQGAPGKDGKIIKPQRLAVVFDPKTPTFRHKMYAEYKANRQKAPEELHAQVPLVEEFLLALKIPFLVHNDFEADDIIATLAEQCRKEKRPCYILSTDKDLLQLVGDGIWKMRPSKSDDAFPYELIGYDEVKNEWGVTPEKILDLLSLTGDSSDNVPGVKGIGEKTAVKLMSRYGSLEEIYNNIAGIEGAIGKKLAEGRESAIFSKSLIKLECNVPLSINNIDELTVENPDRSAGAKMLLREGIRQIAKQLDSKADDKTMQEKQQAGTAAKTAGAAAANAATKTADPAAVDSEEIDIALLGKGTYKIVESIKELETLLEKAREQKLLALDFETDSLDAWNAKPIGISLALKIKQGFYVPLASHAGITKDDNSPAPFLEPDAVKKLLVPLLSDPGMTIAAHNAKFDYKVSRGWGIPEWKCRIWDTMVAAWLTDPDWNNYSLDSLSLFYFDYKAISYNDIVPKGSTFEAVPLETAAQYSAEDSDLCLRLMMYLEKQFKNQKSGDLKSKDFEARGAESINLFLNLEMPLLPILAEMEGLGIKINTGTLKDYGKELALELEEVQKNTFNIVGHEFNLSSPQQLQKVLFEERGLKPGKKTKTRFSTDAEALEELAHMDEVPALILRHRFLSKIKSTYVDSLTSLADAGERLHTNFIQTGTATGRLSSREPNLQNIPVREDEGRRIREAFIAKPGCVLISADYSQIELVILAHLSQDKNLIDSFLKEQDVHTGTAALIFGLDKEKVTPEQRRIAKTINFGIMYGMSAFRLSNELRITRTEASTFIEAYFRTYSGVRDFIALLIRKAEETGYASTIMGRRRYIRAINSGNKTEKAAAERIAVNTPIQGSAADIVKTAMVKLYKALEKAKCPARMLLQVHDELIFECPKEHSKAAADLIRGEMENAIKLSVPLRVSVETGLSWGGFH